MDAKRFAWIVAGVVLAATLGAAPPQQATPAPVAMVEQARLAARRAQVSPYKERRAANGAATAVARAVTKKVYVAALKVPGQTNTASAGFELDPISVTGITISGAKVRAKFNIEGIQGRVVREVVVSTTGGALVGMTSNSSAGPGETTLTSPPFTLEPGKQYVAYAAMQALPDSVPGLAAWAVVTITDISWEF